MWRRQIFIVTVSLPRVSRVCAAKRNKHRHRHFFKRQVMVKVAIEGVSGSHLLLRGENANGDRHNYTSDKFSKGRIYSPSDYRRVISGSEYGGWRVYDFVQQGNGLSAFLHAASISSFIVSALYYGILLQAVMLFSFGTFCFRDRIGTRSLWHKGRENRYFSSQFLVIQIFESMLRYIEVYIKKYWIYHIKDEIFIIVIILLF